MATVPQVSFYPGDAVKKPRSMSASALARPSSAKSNFALHSAKSTTTPAAASTPFAIDRRTVEQQLIDNLRQQVAVLELENSQLKKERASGWASHHGNAESDARPQSASAAGVRANLLQKIEFLQAQVDDLRKGYARREQEHAVEMAEARNRMAESFRGGNSSSYRIAGGGGSGGPGLVSSDEVAQIRAQFEKEFAAAKDRYASEFVHFEKTIERLKAEASAHANELGSLQQEKDDLAKELITVKDAGRVTITNMEVLQRQYQETLHHLAQEQDKRRDLENKEHDAKQRVAELQAQVASLTAGKSATEIESKLKETSAQLSLVSFELDKLRVTEAKMTTDVQRMLTEKAERDVADAVRNAETESLKAKIAALETRQTDVEAEREFFRLSTDRLKVENSVLTVKISQLEAKHNSDRASVLTLERQYAGALDTVELLRRESKSKEHVYKSLDDHDSALRQQVFLSQDEVNQLRRANQELRDAFVDVSTKYDAIKDHADAIRAEQHLQAALQRLDRTKTEMHNLLQTQLKLSNDISMVVGDIPSDASVQHHLQRSAIIANAVSPPPPTRSAGDESHIAITAADPTPLPTASS